MPELWHQVPAPLLVGGGAALGSTVRAIAVEVSGRPTATTVLINILGSFIIGVVAGRHASAPKSPASSGRAWSLAVGIGFCGGFTTFSGFAVDVAERFRGGLAFSGTAAIVVTVAGTVGAAGLGWWFGLRSHPTPSRTDAEPR